MSAPRYTRPKASDLSDLLTSIAYGDKRGISKADRDQAHRAISIVGRLERKARAYDRLKEALKDFTP